MTTKTDAVAAAIYIELFNEISKMNVFELLAAKKAYEARTPYAKAPAELRERLKRIATVVAAEAKR